MKQLVTVMVLFATISIAAQKPNNGRKGQKMDMTVEQLATLKTKKLTLALDLTKAQQAQVMDLSLEQAEFRKARYAEIQAKRERGEWKRPTSDERFEFENSRLDRQIAHQQKMKQVLNKEQYQTWKKLKLRKGMNGKKKMQEKGRRG